MVGDEPVKRDEPPKNRFEQVITKEICIDEAIASKSVTRQINAVIDWINFVLPEIPKKEYDVNILDLKPSFRDIKKEYSDTVDMVVPELIGMSIHYDRCINLLNQRYLEVLQVERGKIQKLLKEHTEWYFGEGMKQSYSV